jgi:hypothetical protein
LLRAVLLHGESGFLPEVSYASILNAGFRRLNPARLGSA